MSALNLPIYRFRPKAAPEWGSGGIFGLKYHMNTLYFTLSFEAEAYFFADGKFNVYRYDLIGPEPRSGGDTYNAVEAVDDKIFFGGWVNSPARFKVVNNYGSIDFTNKYSHIHSYDIREGRVDLLWKESAGLESEWVGEVSSLIFDPVNIRLLVSRADGSRSLGVFSLDLRGSKMEVLSDKPSMKGAILGDKACFDISVGLNGIYGIQCLDLIRGKWEYVGLSEDLKDISVDGEGVLRPLQVGSIATAYGRLFIFVRGGVIVLDPSEGSEGLHFIRLYDFCRKDYGPLRTNHVVVGGGIVIPFNAYTHGILKPRSNELRSISRSINYVPTTSNLLYITPPTVRIIGSFGARITSVEHVGTELLLGCNTMANLGAEDATPYDIGERDLISIAMDNVLRSCEMPHTIKVSGSIVGSNAWGGIPINNYRRAVMHVKASRDNSLRIYEYDLGLPPTLHDTDVVDISFGRNVIDLSDYNNVVSFKFEFEDPRAEIYISLRN
ncbi:MAG: DUF2139 domain-containing protein [Sulfolobales archaeon]